MGSAHIRYRRRRRRERSLRRLEQVLGGTQRWFVTLGYSSRYRDWDPTRIDARILGQLDFDPSAWCPFKLYVGPLYLEKLRACSVARMSTGCSPAFRLYILTHLPELSLLGPPWLRHYSVVCRPSATGMRLGRIE